ncbi:6-phosphofructokinase [Planctomicrobium sp.]|jgi:ATP-dependent phosphofructokinase / diphosphate-dependent phosphofructokinase|nr:ATP-dependent 6-phosphofructokinase [Planctomicrobium sp.]MBT5017609.1 6-phosphofructokinase [Planctomicrobium sp.]MDA7504036.1 6-phosphofructokinase [bacterium]MDB4743355.1 6-phosphofructokinase [Planctomicrobium sp.]
MRVACLTGGGDCPGLNAVIRGLVRTIHNSGGETIGFLEGWRGAIEGNYIELDPMKTDEILPVGGTILGSSRTNPYKEPAQAEKVVETFKKLNLDCLVAIGGDDTLGVASKLYSDFNLPTIGCPKTIDNDLSSTDFTFGFDTCLNTVQDAVDKLRTTAESHRRIMVVEVMGRHAGWITCFAGIACAADAIMVPEEEVDMDAVCERLKQRRDSGKTYGIVMVSEGAKLKDDNLVTKDAEVDDFGHVKLGGIGGRVAKIIEKNTGIETRDVTLGHLQRGGSPSAYDRVLGTRLGIHAGRLANEKEFGKMVALRGLHIVAVPLAEAVGTMRTLYPEFMDEAREFLK